MDALKSLWKSKKSKKGFKGTGHLLGNAPPSQANNKTASQSTAASRHQPLSAASQPSSRSGTSQGRRLGSSPSPASTSSTSSPSRSSHLQQQNDSRRRSTNDVRQQPAAAAEASHAAAPAVAAVASTSSSVVEAPGNAAAYASHNACAQQQHAEPDVPPANDDIQDAVALLRCDERPGAPAIAVLTRLLRNIVISPQDPKFRRLRLQNPKIKEAVVEVAGGIELLQACGFDLIFENTAPEQDEEGFAEQSRGQTSGAAPSAVVPRERSTQVLIPTDVDASVPEWVFERSPAELKAAIVAARRRREQGEVLMTRAMRERLTLGDRRSQPSWGTVRVRMPEGLLLQGEFAAGEPCLAVFAWLTDCLRDPGETYRLVQPRVGALAADARTIRDAGLLPSALLHFQQGVKNNLGG
ncbi:hypothetical protein WJX73_003982 [Symbiochloris irregularis]|uniref:UBX domain-containing protein n=1 Tax=Symbiochloris irregularis TaxID=706552 RepID=A0AAW1Q3A0_9CHLO